MQEHQIIKTAGGEELIVLTRQQYDALIEALTEAEEELADIAVLDQRKAEMAASGVPNWPAEPSRLLLQGNKRVAALRLWRGKSIAELAAESGVTEADIAAFEAGARAQTVDQARQLARALDVPPAWIEP